MAEPEDKDELLFSEDEEPSINLNKEFLSSISLLNTNMLAVNESLKQFSTMAKWTRQNLPKKGHFCQTKKA